MFYIEPPALTREEQLKWIGELNTLLSLRLNLEDFDSIPPAFKTYEIASGRVTFKVAREFEVDLTIADEDVSKQFWFIDFRFSFSPAAANLPDNLRSYLESCVNEALRQDGLAGCYQFLHEFVLTYKINELKRQAHLLNRNFWTGNLKVEPLHRALAIQYWVNRGPSGRPKSWVLIAVESGNGDGTSAKSSSLVAKWYRDNKEVPNTIVPLDEAQLSAESLLREVVGMHIEHILTSIHDKLAAVARFQNKEATLSLHISRNDPAASSLAMQVSYNKEATLLMEPATGSFSVKPHSRFTLQHEYQLNNSSGQGQDGASCLEAVRCALVEDEINRKGNQMGWSIRKAPLTVEQLRSITGLRDWTRTICLQREGWEQHWYIVVFLGMSGDAWWLIEGYEKSSSFKTKLLTNLLSRERDSSSRGPRFHAKLPLDKGPPKMSDAFWDDLTICATGMIAQAIDLADLHRMGVKSRTNGEASWSLSQNIALPAVEVALSAIFPSMVVNGGRKPIAGYEHPGAESLRSLLQPNAALFSHANQPWASDLVTIRFTGLEAAPTSSSVQSNETTQSLLRVSEAIIHVERPARFAALEQTTDKDVSFIPKTGEFKLRLRHPVGQSILPVLRSRIKTVDRFVNFLEAVESGKGGITRGEVSLKAVSCTYPDFGLQGDVDAKPRHWELGLQLSADEIIVTLEKDNPHLLVIDLLQKLVNADGGVWSLMAWLPTSIAAMHAIRDIEIRWSELEAAGKGHLRIFAKTLDWMGMSFTMSPTGKPQRTANFDLKVQSRRGQALWHIQRLDISLPKDDPFGPALQKIWDGRGKNWLGLGSSAAGESDDGIALLLTAVDDALRGVLDAPPSQAATKTQKASNVVVLD
jgi:mediator of RNA polymerase II transcription subunit 14